MSTMTSNGRFDQMAPFGIYLSNGFLQDQWDYLHTILLKVEGCHATDKLTVWSEKRSYLKQIQIYSVYSIF